MSGVMAAGFFVGYGWHWASDDAGAACRTRLKQGLWRLAAVDGAGWLFGGLLYLIFGMFLAGTERSLAVCMEHWRKQIWIAVSCDDDAVSSPAWAIGFAIYRLCASLWLVAAVPGLAVCCGYLRRAAFGFGYAPRTHTVQLFVS